MTVLVQADGVTPLVSVSPRIGVTTRGQAGPTAYSAADPVSQELAGWFPRRGSADGDLSGERETIDARANDMVRNNGWLGGFVERQLDKVIGDGLRLSAKPDYRALGLTPQWARDWSREVEAAYRQWASDPNRNSDLSRQLNAGGQQALGYAHYMKEGDAIAVLHWRERRGTLYRTCVQVMDPVLLSNPNDGPDDRWLRRGVEKDDDGVSVAFHFRRAHAGEYYPGAESYVWDRVERETAWGRPIVVHYYDAHIRAGLTRGVSMFASILARAKMLDRYEAVELQAAVLNAILAAFIESPFDHTLLQEALDDGAKFGDYQAVRNAFHQTRNFTLGGVKIPTLFPGEKIGFQAAARPNSAFAAFETASLRGIAAGLGTSTEELTQNWTETTYSSARAALLESWVILAARRKRFADGFWTPIYGAWLEDAIDLGVVQLPPNAPSFHDARAAYMRCKWIGPGRGWVDPVKEKQGAVMGISAGLSTLEDEAAEQGRDWEETLDQIASEIASMPKGVVHPAMMEFYKLIGQPSPPDAPAGGAGGRT